MMRLAAIWVAAILLGCGSSGSDNGNSAGGGNGGSHEAGGGGAGAASTSGGSGGKSVEDAGAGDEAGTGNEGCTIELSNLAPGCPSTFDGSAARAVDAKCTRYSPSGCDGFLWLQTGVNFSGQLCAYDAATYELVGAEAFDDVPEYCNGKSFTEVAGRLPSDTCTNAGMACGEAGAAGMGQLPP